MLAQLSHKHRTFHSRSRMAAFGGAPRNVNGDIEVQRPATSDSYSSLDWAPSSDFLIAGAWDSKLRCWEVKSSTTGAPTSGDAKLEVALPAPVLDVSWMEDNAHAFAGACDNCAYMWTLQTNTVSKVAEHKSAIKSVAWIPEMKTLATGAWDRTIQYWDTRSPTAVAAVNLPERVYSMDVSYPLMVVATADRKVFIYNLTNPQVHYRELASPLKFQTRVVRCFKEKSGFGLASIEGRCVIKHADPAVDVAPQSFSFKCHRQAAGAVTDVYPVNAIDFNARNPQVFVTGGSDGVFSFWNKESRLKLVDFKSVGKPITAARWNYRGNILAYAASYDWSMGAEYYDSTQPNSIYLHHTTDDQLANQPKAAGRK